MSELDFDLGPKPPSLRDADWLKRPETRAVFDALNRDGAETRAVGGAVRNALLGLPVSEIDLATTAVPEKVMALAEEAGLKSVPTGIDHGTVTIIADGVPFEVTTLRRDVETFGRHANVAFTTSWEEDAKRRDFTLNALYADREGKVFDPIGGLADLFAGRVRFIGDAAARIEEDYLRILRFFRVHAYYGKGRMDEEGLHAAVKLRGGLDRLSAERVGAELKRLLVAPRAAAAVVALYDYGLLTDLLGGVPLLDRFERLVALENALGLQPDASLRLAALAVFVEEDVARLVTRLRLSKSEQETLALAARLRPDTRAPEDSEAKEWLYRLGAPHYRAYILLSWAASGAAVENDTWQRAHALPERWEPPSFPLRGADIMALGIQGPDIGETLRQLERDWIAADFALSRDALLAKARRALTDRAS